MRHTLRRFARSCAAKWTEQLLRIITHRRELRPGRTIVVVIAATRDRVIARTMIDDSHECPIGLCA
jgi:hypothetical protein